MKDAFVTLTGVAAPLNLDNVDTDRILPARFLKTIERTGLGVHLFESLRYHTDGTENHDFVLNREKFRRAAILLAGDNFGCGSSREHAPWALLDFGIRCVIAPGFADIFYGNCFKNGILPIVLARDICDGLLADAASAADARLTVDLARQVIMPLRGEPIPFAIDPFRKHCLLNGLDDIDLTLEHASAIDEYERHIRDRQPWRPKVSTN